MITECLLDGWPCFIHWENGLLLCIQLFMNLRIEFGWPCLIHWENGSWHIFEPIGRVGSFGKTAVVCTRLRECFMRNIAGTDGQYYRVKAWFLCFGFVQWSCYRCHVIKILGGVVLCSHPPCSPHKMVTSFDCQCFSTRVSDWHPEKVSQIINRMDTELSFTFWIRWHS